MSEDEIKMEEIENGQLEMEGIDTPLGQSAKDYLEAVGCVAIAKDNVAQAKNKVFEEMEKISKNTFKYEGKTFSRVKGKISEDTLRISS